MMKLIMALCLISITSAITTATGETMNIGPANISLDLGILGSYYVEKGDPTSEDHKKPDFQYEIIPINIKVDGTSNQVQIEVHKMSMSEPLESPISRKDQASGLEHCIEKSNMIQVGEDILTEPYTIDGQQGLLATINSDPGNPFYIVAYSPDKKSGSGTVVCIIGSNLPWETTKSIFDSAKTRIEE
jgi:hypothetical protein